MDYLYPIYCLHPIDVLSMYDILPQLYLCIKDTAAKKKKQNKLSLLSLCQQPQLGLEALALLWNDGDVPGITSAVAKKGNTNG